jgi:hypothetical protein
MITNFNAISCETSSALEMLLDWCHSFTKVSLQPKAVLKQLLEGVPLKTEQLFEWFWAASQKCHVRLHAGAPGCVLVCFACPWGYKPLGGRLVTRYGNLLSCSRI